MSAGVAAALAGAAAGVGLLGDDAGGRLRAVLPPAGGRPASRVRLAGELDVRLLRGACALAAGAVLLLAPGVLGLLLATALVLWGPRAGRRLQPPPWEIEDREAARDLPLALDLLASCLSGGAPLDRAVGAVAGAVPGACGRRLSRVSAALAVGSPPAEAWQLLATARPPSAGRASSVGGAAGAAARALARASDGGAPVATTVARIAASARAEARAEASRAAGRAGVLAVGPLALCFLPAFVLLGVVPAVVGLAGPLLRGL